ncbi:YtxH domain-containing protein [Dehalobacterium formicoaceticum]|uniref:YtxH domain-containing protein n=1 Tax=Dehalobacterium formicoaceticum TaxID=51515 RepID=A0ABT1Y7B3_9FIRM|nr:YtxH domain-containing protein [Dehalobacterium formicoaceticum]MCR6546786.1 YtxH domain-containing protein [Dehalobacterium formicoaceticum]
MNNRSFIKGILAGSIIGTVLGMFTAPQRKPFPESAQKMIGQTQHLQSKAKRVLKGINKGVSEMMK